MAKRERCWRGSTATFECIFGDGSRQSGVTLLMVAMTYGHEELTEALLRRGADVSLQSSDGSTALGLAAANGHEKLVELALRHGAEINLQANNGGTALMFAVLGNHPSPSRTSPRRSRRLLQEPRRSSPSPTPSQSCPTQ